MDTIIFVVTMVGASLAVALLFASTVLSRKWRDMISIHRHHGNKNGQQKKPEKNKKLISEYIGVKIKSQSQSLVQLKRISSLSELINKKVKTCEMVDIGHVIAVNDQSITVLHGAKQEYIIPTYYVREYDQENIVIDISIRYLLHYKTEGNQNKLP